MQNWQDLLNYVNNVLITYDPSYLNKARYGNDLLLSLANEAFNRLKALDYVCFVNDYACNKQYKDSQSSLTHVIRYARLY